MPCFSLLIYLKKNTEKLKIRCFLFIIFRNLVYFLNVSQQRENIQSILFFGAIFQYMLNYIIGKKLSTFRLSFKSPFLTLFLILNLKHNFKRNIVTAIYVIFPLSINIQKGIFFKKNEQNFNFL